MSFWNINSFLMTIMDILNMNQVTFSVFSGFILGVLFFMGIGFLRIMYSKYIKRNNKEVQKERYEESDVDC